MGGVIVRRGLTIALVLVWTCSGRADTVDGVFGVTGVESRTEIAVWIPLEVDSAIAGLRWYNNDGTRNFEDVRAMAGISSIPDSLSGAVVLARGVRGVSSGWSSLQFPQAIASASEGIYVVFGVPSDGGLTAQGDGGGCGVGYTVGDGRIRCWMSSDGFSWDALSARYQMAVEVVPVLDKTVDVLVLGRQGGYGSSDARDLSGAGLQSTAVGAYPNPFNPSTVIQYSVGSSGRVIVDVYDVRGRVVRCLVDEDKLPGDYSVEWDGRNGTGQQQSSGTYLLRLRVGGVQRVGRITLLK